MRTAVVQWKLRVREGNGRVRADAGEETYESTDGHASRDRRDGTGADVACQTAAGCEQGEEEGLV